MTRFTPVDWQKSRRTRLAMQALPAIRKAVPADALHISQLIGQAAHHFNSSVSGEVAAWFLGYITPSAIAANISNPGFNYLVGFSYSNRS